MYKLIVIVILIKSCAAKLELCITLTSSRSSSKGITYSGQNEKLITNQEIKLFNISEDNLKAGFRKELGKRPDDVFLKDPTYYGKLFERYKWRQTYRIIKIDRTEVIGIVNKEYTIKVTDIINNTTETISAEYSSFEMVENDVSSSWYAAGIPNDIVSYNLTIKYGLQNVTFTKHWRDNKPKYNTTMFGIKTNGFVKVPPGKVVTKTLSGMRTTMVVKVHYKAYLNGLVVGNYGHTYGKYHFYSPSIDNIMKAANISNEIITTEVIQLNWYTDPSLTAVDKITKEPAVIDIPNKLFGAIKRNKIGSFKRSNAVKKKKINIDSKKKENKTCVCPEATTKRNKRKHLNATRIITVTDLKY
ncbi:uncharacterized protein LOC121737998 [Aricia agestis]|uniref:uncharacterized protein LOC121737998 n=1 Tax=Aricia agestis TaxID=91739 RepID=UPI001C2072B3|nr:uncharacterized protein LOC121737998 [Aricia agestis]